MILKSILQNYGIMTEDELFELSKVYPNIKVVVKYGLSPRVSLPACQATRHIEENCHMADSEDYVRAIFLSAELYDTLTQALAVQVFE